MTHAFYPVKLVSAACLDITCGVGPYNLEMRLQNLQSHVVILMFSLSLIPSILSRAVLVVAWHSDG